MARIKLETLHFIDNPSIIKSMVTFCLLKKKCIRSFKITYQLIKINSVRFVNNCYIRWLYKRKHVTNNNLLIG